MKRDFEHQIQKGFFKWVNISKARYPELALMHAIPNGGKRDIVTASKMKAEGVQAGVPDAHLPVARGGYVGLWIEFKTKEGKLSNTQKYFICELEKAGNRVVICRSINEAVDVVVGYLQSDNKKRSIKQELFQNVQEDKK